VTPKSAAACYAGDVAYRPIEHYGVVGDLHTVALVGTDGSVDFMCAPRFDSPSVFAALLDDARGGRFQLAPVLDNARHRQLYLPDTCVLLTRFLSDDGVAEVSDFMPVEESGGAHNLVRHYARAPHTVERTRDGALFVSKGHPEMAMRLRASVPLRLEDGAALAEFTLRADESAHFVLEQVQQGEESPTAEPHYVADAFKSTVNFWRAWIGRSTYQGRWREMVNRSALTLKLLTSREFGSMVAAPTFGLPEVVGGVRNWDYRYAWIRDASFSLYALMRLGFTDEAAGFMRWVEARAEELEPDGSLQIMYGIDGRHALPEEILDHLEGYCGSKPVRVGNAAHTHLQLDIYGELMDSIYLYDKYGEQISYDLWANVTRFIDWVCENWRQPDEGIWEVRGGRQEFLCSRVGCWAAIDRAVRLAGKRSLPAPLARWHTMRDEIHADIYEHFWHPRRGVFVQAKGTHGLDASALLMPLIKFIGATDPRWLSTLRAIEQELVRDSLVYRYRTGDDFKDGLVGEEGTFGLCSFWYVECLSRAGDLQQARFLFEKMLGYANHVGLFAEEIGQRGEHLGNFPQAFTHVALISAAYDLDRRLSARGHPA
jgi:GH15 family glucan-1,4-alpha-glucosidase